PYPRSHPPRRVCCLARRPPISTLFPYTTLFRSSTARLLRALDLVITVDTFIAHLAGALGVPVWLLLHHQCDWRWGRAGRSTIWRSEEHTSELQSRENLVCRLLLEKKKHTPTGTQ